MRCLDVKVELQAYIDGELDPERAALLECHLAGCESCRAELARLQTVVVALETWPLVAEPAHLTARVMARVRPRPVVSAACPEPRRRIEPSALPPFRLRWSDFAISLAGAGLAFVAVLAWRYLAPAGLDYLRHAHVALRLEVLWLEVLLLAHRLVRSGAAAWGLLLGGVALVVVLALAFAMRDLTAWERGGFPTQKSAS